MPIYYFLNPGVSRWWVFLATTAGFGALAYVAVGSTRASLVLAFAVFLFIGLADRYIKAQLLAPLAVLSVLGIILLALGRGFPAVRDAFAANFFDTGHDKAVNLAGCSWLPRRVATGQREQLIEW